MKLKLVMLGIIAMLALSLIACSAGSPANTVAVSIDDFTAQKNINQQIEVAAGDSFTVALGSNQTTGFQWSEPAQVSDNSVLQQTDHEYVVPDSKAMGAPGKQVWTFAALKKGTAVISMEYSRPWEGGEKAEWTFTLTVIVK